MPILLLRVWQIFGKWWRLNLINPNCLAIWASQSTLIATSPLLPIELREKTQLGIFKYCHSPFGVAFFCLQYLRWKAIKRGNYMHEVKVYDSSGKLKKMISTQTLNIRSKQRLETPLCSGKIKKGECHGQNLPKLKQKLNHHKSLILRDLSLKSPFIKIRSKKR